MSNHKNLRENGEEFVWDANYSEEKLSCWNSEQSFFLLISINSIIMQNKYSRHSSSGCLGRQLFSPAIMGSSLFHSLHVYLSVSVVGIDSVAWLATSRLVFSIAAAFCKFYANNGGLSLRLLPPSFSLFRIMRYVRSTPMFLLAMR